MMNHQALRQGIRGRTQVEPRESTRLGIKCRFPPLQSRPFPLFPSLRSVLISNFIKKSN